MSSDLETTIEMARSWARQHYFALSQRKRLGNTLAAQIRTIMGWTLFIPEPERKVIEKSTVSLIRDAQAYFKAIDAGKDAEEPDHDDFDELRYMLRAGLASTAPYDQLEREANKRLEKIGAALPVSSWWISHHYMGARQLAQIIAETGDLNNYPNFRHVWKRMGLAPYQGLAYSNWRKGGKNAPRTLKADEWTEAGYSPRRRSLCFVMSDVICRSAGQPPKDGEPNPYLEVYRQRREHTAVTHPEWTKGHSNDDAKRVMIKAIIRDLWREWRNETGAKNSLPLEGGDVETKVFVKAKTNLSPVATHSEVA
jgi:hypothetical protein